MIANVAKGDRLLPEATGSSGTPGETIGEDNTPTITGSPKVVEALGGPLIPIGALSVTVI